MFRQLLSGAMREAVRYCIQRHESIRNRGNQDRCFIQACFVI